MQTVKIQIKGATWECRLLTKKKYEKLHGYDSSAITVGNARQIDFLKADLIPGFVIHELLHAYVYECNTESSNLDPDQREELCCSILGEYIHTIVLTAFYILTKFMS